jgi:GAF domain-containing protein
MLNAPIPDNEKERMDAVNRLGLLDDKPDNRFDLLTKRAVKELRVPISTLTVLDPQKEHYKSCQGLNEKDGARAISFCGHALLMKDLFIIPDTAKDIRFANNPMVIGKPFIRSYMGMALFDHKTGLPVAVFCVKDTKPREFSLAEIDAFSAIVTLAEEEINK